MHQPIIKNIFHIHNRCNGHASLEVKEIFDYASKHGYKSLIFTEHCPLDNNNLIFRNTRDELISLKDEIKKYEKLYKGKIKVEFGYEIEFPLKHNEYFRKFKEEGICDFVIFGNHYYGDMWTEERLIMTDTFSKEDLEEYYQSSKLALEWGYMSWFAHPDIWLFSYRKWDKYAIDLSKKLISLAIKYDIPLGFNANGIHHSRDGFNYPSEHFWKLVANSKAKVLIEADAHHIQTATVEWLNKTYDEAIKYGLKNNLIFDLKLKKFKK